jgi:anaerobic selenocysteine-containing dehydrogenase
MAMGDQQAMATNGSATWHKTACSLCSLNCGLEVQVGGPDGRHITRIKGDKDHPISLGYLCEKAQRLNFYQTAGDRLNAPLRRRADGSFESIDWDTAIREVAAKLADIKARYGGDTATSNTARSRCSSARTPGNRTASRAPARVCARSRRTRSAPSW